MYRIERARKRKRERERALMTRGKFTREKRNMDAVSDAAQPRCRTITKQRALAPAAADRSPPWIMANVSRLSSIVYVAYKSRVVPILLLPCQTRNALSPVSARRFSLRGSFALRVSRCKAKFQCAPRSREASKSQNGK